MFSRNWLRSLSILIALLALLWLGSPSEAAWAIGGKQPDLGEPAPVFTLPSTTGEGEVSLEDYRGQWVVLYFYPKDFTPGCTVEARRFQQDLPKYEERNAQIIGVSADDVESHVEFCDSEGLRFPLLADLDGDVSKTYGSWMGFVSLRHTYLIDPEGRLQEIFTGVRPIVHSQEVLVRLDELQAG